MTFTYPTTLEIWLSHQQSAEGSQRAYERYARFETDKCMIIEIPVYRGTLIKKVYFDRWEISRDGDLYIAFTTRLNGCLYKRPVNTVTLIGFEEDGVMPDKVCRPRIA
jgi:hypothetical protein